jgi:hypothetical protein
MMMEDDRKPFHNLWDHTSNSAWEFSDEESESVIELDTDEWQALHSEEIWDAYVTVLDHVEEPVPLADWASFVVDGCPGTSDPGPLARSIARAPGTWKANPDLWRISDPVELAAFLGTQGISDSSSSI